MGCKSISSSEGFGFKGSKFGYKGCIFDLYKNQSSPMKPKITLSHLITSASMGSVGYIFKVLCIASTTTLGEHANSLSVLTVSKYVLQVQHMRCLIKF